MSFSHQEFNQPAFVDPRVIRLAMETGRDLFGRGEEEDLVPWSGQVLPRCRVIFEGASGVLNTGHQNEFVAAL